MNIEKRKTKIKPISVCIRRQTPMKVKSIRPIDKDGRVH